MDDAVDAVFAKLAAGELPASSDPLQSGWEATLPIGRVVTRSMLEGAARELIPLGAPAVLPLLKWADHDNVALRYVATFALGEITKVRPYVPHFLRTDEHGYRARAIETWRKWYEDRTK